MTPKVAYQNILRRLSQWSSAPKGNSRSGRAYRTEFQRFLWGSIFVVGYFTLIFFHFSGAEEGSADNNGIWFLLIFGLVFAAIGAYFAPGWSSLVKTYTASGRRLAVEKQAQVKKSQRSSRHHSDSGRERSSSSSRRSREHSGSKEQGEGPSTKVSEHSQSDSSNPGQSDQRQQNTKNTG